MPQYLRRRQSGGTYFFTARLADRSSALLLTEVDRLRDATRQTLARYPFRIDAIAVLPAAIHTIWTLPEGDSDFSRRWSMLKSQFSRGLPDPVSRSAAQRRRRDKGIWQQRFWEHLIRDRADFDTHLQMIHSSPVQAGLCATPPDWPHSSVHRYLAAHGPLPSAPGHGRPHGLSRKLAPPRRTAHAPAHVRQA